MSNLKSRVGATGAILLGMLILGAALVVMRMDTTGSKGSGLGAAFDYDLSRWARTDPKLVMYRETNSIPTGLAEVRALAVGPADDIYVAGARRVRVFDEDGTPRPEIALDGEPTAVAVGPQGWVYVGIRDHVEIYGTNGARLASWPVIGPNAIITSVAVGTDTVFVADAGNREVLRCDDHGRPVGRLTGFIVPSPYLDMVLAPDGTLRVTDPGRHRIGTYASDGKSVSWWGRASFGMDGFSGCCNPVHLAALPGGELVTSEKGLPRVKIYGGDGQFVGVVAGAEAFAGGGTVGGAGLFVDGRMGIANDVAADRQGRIFVLDSKTKTIRVFVRKDRHED